jgi:hypothetical protein
VKPGVVLVAGAALAAVIAPAPRARACGAGVVTTQAGAIGADAQRIILSVHDGITDVITQIGVPSTTADYGALIPVPGQPTLDPNPVASADVDALDRATAPSIKTYVYPSSSGCGCPLKSGAAGEPVPFDGGAEASQPVTIGPLTAVTLTADTGDAIAAWLTQNGFVLPAGAQSLVDAYAGPGSYFIALRRADSAATGGPTSVGVHFSLAGDQRALPLRFARLGAAAKVAFTIFVAAADVSAPSAPFAALTLQDIDAHAIATSGYATALADTVAQHGNHAFVLEGAWSSATADGGIGYTLQSVLLGSQHLTRLSTIVPAEALDTDVTLDQPFTGHVYNERYVQRLPGRDRSPRLAFGAALLAVAAIVRRRARG